MSHSPYIQKLVDEGHVWRTLPQIPRGPGHIRGEIFPDLREQLEWPPRAPFLVYNLNTAAIWYTYKIGRWFPTTYIYATDPRGADCEAPGAEDFIFDIRNLPKAIIGRYRIEYLSTGDMHRDHIRQWRAHRGVLGRAITQVHDFIGHEKASRATLSTVIQAKAGTQLGRRP